MAIPKQAEIRLSLLKLLYENKDKELPLKGQILPTLIKEFNLTQEEVEKEYEISGDRVFEDGITWMATSLKYLGFITREKNVMKITKKGEDYWKEYKDDREELRRRVYEDKKQRKRKPISSGDEISTDEDATKETIITEEVIDRKSQENEEELKENLRTTLDEMDEYKFEELSVKLLEGMGYGKGVVTPATRDRGIDGLIRKDPLGIVDKIYIQAKKFKDSPVSSKDIQAFKGAIGEAKGVFVTTSKFSGPATEVKGDIVLIDGEKLINLLIEYKLGIKETYIFREVDMESDFFKRTLPKEKIFLI